VLSTANAVGNSHSDCIIFNPSIFQKSATFAREGLFVRQCCGSGCVGHSRRLGSGGGGGVGGSDHAERIGFAACDLLAGTSPVS